MISTVPVQFKNKNFALCVNTASPSKLNQKYLPITNADLFERFTVVKSRFNRQYMTGLNKYIKERQISITTFYLIC